MRAVSRVEVGIERGERYKSVLRRQEGQYHVCRQLGSCALQACTLGSGQAAKATAEGAGRCGGDGAWGGCAGAKKMWTGLRDLLGGN